MMRVAIFTDTYLPDVNGVARTLGRWTDYLKSRGVCCKVFAPQSDEGYPNGNDRQWVQRFYSIPFLLYPECKLAIPNPLQVNKILQQFQPTLIHVATPFNLGLYGLRFAKKHNIPLVASYHTHFDQYLSYYKLQWMEPMLWRFMLWFHQECQKTYVPSLSTLRHLQEKGMQRLEVWGRGVDVARFHPLVNRQEVLQKYKIDPFKFILLYVGRLAPEKSIDVLMGTFAQLPERLKQQSHMIVAGDGPLMKELREQYEGNPKITFTGFVEGKALSDLYAAADLMLFPSATETFGNVVIEAMASGTPVIGAAAGGVKDNIVHQKTGWLCTPGNVGEFVSGVEQLFHHPSLRETLATNGRAYSLQQSWDQIFTKLYAGYLEILDVNRQKDVSNFATISK